MTQPSLSPHNSGLRVFSASLLSALLIIMPFVQLAAGAKQRSEVRGQRSEGGTSPTVREGVQTQAAPQNLFLNAPIPKPAPEPPGLLAPTISATMTDAILNDDADSKADPNPPSTEKIEYTATISNTGSTASSVVFNATVDPHTTLDAASVNVSPLSRNDSYTAIGNTLLEVGVAASGSPAVIVSGSVFDNDTEFLGDTFTLKAVQAVNFAGGNTTATTANGGTVTMEPDGNFSYLPPVDSTTTDTFTYTITDDGPDSTLNTPDDLTSTSTVTITFPVTTKVWWVDNTYAGANGASDGRSTRPYTSLTPLNGVDLDDPGDVIYVHTGSGNYTAGITMEANQQLIGNGVALVVNSITLRTAGTRPTILVGAGDAVSVPEISGVVIRGLNLNGAVNAIDVTTTGANSGGVEIADNVITGAGQEGIDVNGGGSGTMTVSIHDNSVTATGNGIDVRRTAGSVNVTAFDDNQVLGTTGGIGIIIAATTGTVLFDTNPGTATFDTVGGGTTVVGASGAGNGAGAGGMTLSNVRGDLSFTDLDLYADTGAAFFLLGTTPNYTGTSGTRVVANTGTPTLVAASGAGLDVTDANINIVPTSFSSSISTATRGVSLLRVSGTFTAISGSPAITNSHASGIGFFIDGGASANANVNVTYSGTIFADIGRLVQIQSVSAASTHAFSGLISDNQDAGGADGGESGILLSTNSGATMSFTGGLNINTTTNTAFSATGGGTVTATQNNTSIVNTLSSVSNTALTVTSTNIGALGLTFRSINAGNNTAAAEPVNGILLTSTGTAAGNGGLTVTGNSSGNCGGVSNPSSVPNTADCTGGTIQKASGTGVSLSSTKAPSLTRMYVFDNGGDGIKASTSSNVSVISSYLDSNADQTTPDESGLYLLETYGTATITNTWISNSFETDLRIENSNVTNGALTVNMSGCSVFNTGASTQAGNLFNFLSTLTSNMTLNLSNSRFDGNRVVGALTTDGIHADTSGGTAVVNVSSSTFVDNFVGISVTLGGSANSKTMDYDLNGNTVTGSEGSAINVTAIAGFAGDTMEGKVRNNVIGTSGVMNSGSLLGFGMDIDNESIATYTVAITGNTVREIRRFDGINARQVVSAGTTNVTITGNTIDQIRNDFGSNVFGIVVSNTIAGGTTCGNISGNTLTNIDPSGFGNGKDLRVREAAGTLNITQATPTAAVNPAELDDANGIPGLVEVVGVPSFSQPACVTVAMLDMHRNDRDVVASQRTIQTDTQSSWAATAQALTSVVSEVSSLFEASTHSTNDATRVDSVTQVSETRTRNELRTHHASLDAKKARTTDDVSEQAEVRSHHARVTKLKARNSKLSAMAAPLSGEAVGPLALGTLQNGDTVIIKFQVTVDNPPDLNNPTNPLVVTQPAVATQGSVSYNDGATPQTPVLTDEVAGGAVTATETPVDLFDLTNSLACTPDPSGNGQQVTCTATLTENPAQAVDPNSTVDFIDTSDTNAVICNDVALSGAAGGPYTAQCQTSLLTVGTHNLRADYSGDGNFDASQSNLYAQDVLNCVTNPTVTTNADSGAGSLRQAIADACDGNTIDFNIAGAGPHTINLLAASGALTISNNLTINNTSGESITVNGAAGIRVFTIASGKTVAISNLTIASGAPTGLNFEDKIGGGILNQGALTLTNCTVSGNTAAEFGGGGIYNYLAGATLNLVNSTVSGNHATGTSAGGGIYNNGGDVSLTDSTVSGNDAAGNSGGIHNDTGPVSLTGSTVSGNTANFGGGITTFGTLTLTNSTISSNNANTDGGGLYINATGATFTSVTFTNNRADNDSNATGTGGGIFVFAGTPELRNTIVAGNFNENNPAADTADDIAGPGIVNATSSFNLIGTGGAGGLTTTGAPTHNQVGVASPGLGSLLNNGGPTFTHALLTGSLAIDQGDDFTLTTDQRGQPRPIDNPGVTNLSGGTGDGSDIGAFEKSFSPIPAVTTTAGNLSYAENDPATAIDPGLTVTDDDSANLVDASASITTNFQAGQDVLSWIDNNAGDNITLNVGSSTAQTIVLTGTDTLANYEAALRAVTYQNTSDNPSTLTRTVTFTVNDGTNAGSGTRDIAVSASNDNPAINSNGGGPTASVNAAENQTAVTTVTSTDPDGGTPGYSIIGGADMGAFSIGSLSGILTFNSPPDFENPTDAGTNNVYEVTVQVSDGAAGFDTQAISVTVTNVNEAPAITSDGGGPTASVNAAENQTAVTTVTSSDVDGGAPSYSISGGADMGAFSIGSLSGVLTFNSSPNFESPTDAGANNVYEVEVQVSDGNSGTDTQAISVTVTNTNEAPVNTVPVTQGTNLDSPLTFSSGNGNQISVADVDAGSNTIQVALSVTNGTLTLNGITGLNFGCGGCSGDGTADASMTFQGTLTDINNALNGMVFTPTSGFSGTAVLSITSNDLGNTGSGGAQSDGPDTVNIQVATNLKINDASAPEPSTGSSNMLFTVTLSGPAPLGGASVQYATANGGGNPANGGASCATPGVDYETVAPTTLTFLQNEQFKTISVTICSDAANDPNETFLVNLSSPVNATIAAGTATGTITEGITAGTVLISELRTSGPLGAGDDFVEIYNNSNSAKDISGYGLFKMAAGDCNGTPVLIATVPGAPGSNTTVIPARGHYLFVGSAYSLADYGGIGAAAGNLTLSADIETDANVGLFSTSDVTGISTVNRLDAVGFGANTGGACDLLREGSTLPPIAANATIEHSYFRKMCDWLQGQACTVPGIPKDTNNNAVDFWLADTAYITGRLGAPGPENLASPIRRDNANNPGPGGISVFLLDGTVGSAAGANRARNGGAPEGSFGTMTLRYRVTNNTGGNVTRLRYRIVDISTAIQPAGPTADLRALTSVNEDGVTIEHGNVVPQVGPVNDPVTCTSQGAGTPCTVTVLATTLETPPNQAIGGGYNSTLSSDTVTITPLPNGQSILINFRLGVEKTGQFRFYIIVEALP